MRWLIAIGLIGAAVTTNCSMEASPSLAPNVLEAAKAQRVRETQACIAVADQALAEDMQATYAYQACQTCAQLLAGYEGPPPHDLRDQYSPGEARAERARIANLRTELAWRDPLLATAFTPRPARAPWAFDMDEALIDDAAYHYCATVDATPLASRAPFS